MPDPEGQAAGCRTERRAQQAGWGPHALLLGRQLLPSATANPPLCSRMKARTLCCCSCHAQGEVGDVTRTGRAACSVGTLRADVLVHGVLCGWAQKQRRAKAWQRCWRAYLGSAVAHGAVWLRAEAKASESMAALLAEEEAASAAARQREEKKARKGGKAAAKAAAEAEERRAREAEEEAAREAEEAAARAAAAAAAAEAEAAAKVRARTQSRSDS